METRGYTAAALGAAMGTSGTQISYWRNGVYIPPPDRAIELAEILDEPRIIKVVAEARIGRCPMCGKSFDRGQTRRAYCSKPCQVASNYKSGVKPDDKQEAIDAMCRGCEPEGVCRDDGCALRPFSPLVFITLRRSA